MKHLGFSLIADLRLPDIFHLKPQKLAAAGIRLLLADLDNTLTPYSADLPTEAVRQWKNELEQAGITMFVVSNSRKAARVPNYCESLGIGYVRHAGKPGVKGFLKAMEETGHKPEQTLMVGDQIFTDILGAGRAGIAAVLVEPVELAGNPGRYLRYAVEWPFRRLARKEGTPWG